MKRYNDAAGKLNRPSIDVEEVLSYVFLGQFDLLRDSRHEITRKPWTRKAEREAAVKFFKLERAREELKRLSIELRRLHAYTVATNARMKNVVAEATKRDALLAFQLRKREERRLRIAETHLQQLAAINSWAKFLPQANDEGALTFDGREDVGTMELLLQSTETEDLEMEAAEIDAEAGKVGFSESLAILSMSD